ncbi:auxilin-like protein, partial [Trifolium pratense]
MVYEWVGGKHVCVNLTGVLPLVGLRAETFTVRQSVFKDASSKVAKHEKTCSDNQHAFISFAFDTFSVLAPEV